MNQDGLRPEDIREAQGAGRAKLELLEVRAGLTHAIVVLGRDEDGPPGVAHAREPARDVARAKTIPVDTVEAQRFEDEHAAVRRVRAERLGEGGAPHLRGEALSVPAAVGSEHHTAVPPLRRASRALTGAPCPLLAPRLGTATRNPRAVLCRRRSLSRVGERGDERLEEDATAVRWPPERGG